MPVQRPNPGPRLETLASHSDPSVPLVSVYTPSRRPIPDPEEPSDTDALETVARTLETAVLKDRFSTSGANHERLDVYSLPPATATDSEEEAIKDGLFATLAEADAAVQRCVAHQWAEIAARENSGKEWYIQRYDVLNGEWRRAIAVVRTPVAEWEWGMRDKTGRGMMLSTVMFDRPKDGPHQVCVSSGSTEGDIQTLVHELRHELNWQHSFVQFLN
ncbi:hypothetical protein INS49_014341 [Diaporthe citri]|uniref:uncharacterized protein n=1 Tax=Diaporthe citri TaxID=83186 RepID=UPI001C81EE5B|nr:uncharacterized protein INS49_014341 [Diaporthe citri]KAG6358457.1 hypothetical protein INS49_014341 [Diaporthe citri]